jgi:hypothetical protein
MIRRQPSRPRGARWVEAYRREVWLLVILAPSVVIAGMDRAAQLEGVVTLVVFNSVGDVRRQA